MSLQALLEDVVQAFRPGSPNAPANVFVFGFVIPDHESVSIRFNRETAQIVSGVREAEYLVYGMYAVFEAVLNPLTPNRVAWVAQLHMKPEYPFNNYLLSIFLNTFDLAIHDLDYAPKRFDGPYPFPLRYPVAENPFRFRADLRVPLPLYDAQQLPIIAGGKIGAHTPMGAIGPADGAAVWTIKRAFPTQNIIIVITPGLMPPCSRLLTVVSCSMLRL